jgi:putative membrane-bound dehydrogenase-like protein
MALTPFRLSPAMHLPALRSICALVALAALSPAADPAPTPIFNGQSLDGWQGNPGIWSVKDNAITAEIKPGNSLDHNEWLWFHQPLHDFELSLEYRISGNPSANSGIQIRSERLPDNSARGLQCDLDDGAQWLGRIYDEHGRALLMERGSRVSIAPDGRRWSDPFASPDSFRAIPAANSWNRYRIRASNTHIEVWINDVFFGALDDHQSNVARSSGLLGLQLHSGPGPASIQFRNILLTNLGHSDLPPAPPNASAQAADPPAFLPSSPSGQPLPLNFESGSLTHWSATGNAFARQPVQDDSVAARGRGQHSRHAGKWWIGTYELSLSDAPTGTLTSDPFTVSHPWASFLIGGGSDPKSVRVEIVDAASGTVFHSASGRDSEEMHRESVDMRPLAGKSAFLRLVDQSAAPWGHLNFDDFIFHPDAPVFPSSARSRQEESPVLWHLLPNPGPPSSVPNPAAQQTVAGMMLTHGFKADLIAAEPDVVQPIAFSIDDSGRLWILEGLSYPNKQPDGMGRDRIVVLADRDSNGSFESRSVFTEGLNLASGIETGFGGVFVGAAPHLLFIPDRNNDLVPDGPPEILLDGWGFQDTHETLNSFSWGPDGWLYGCQGVFTSSLIGKPGSPPDRRTPLNSGVWRFHPISRSFEIFARGGSNQWGLDYNELGHFFMTHCRSFFGGGGTTCVIRNGHFWNQANNGYAPFISSTAPDFAPHLRNYLPASALYDSGEGGAGKPGTTAIFGGHSHIGTLIYQGSNWPAPYQNHLFTHNLHGHQINHQLNVRSGSAYETMHAGSDLAFTPDPRYMAVDLQSGPDGAVYSIDWFDQQHCHSPIEEKWDRSNGRVYRLSWAATFQPANVNLSSASDAELADLQLHPDVWHRRHARRLLMERAAARPLHIDAVTSLLNLAASPNTPLALRGLWSLHQSALLTPDLLAAAARHHHDAVRAWAVQLGSESSGPRLPAESLISLAASDPSAMVRLALASAIPNLDAPTAWDVASRLAAHPEDRSDRFLPRMIWLGLAPLAPSNWPRAFSLAANSPIPDLLDNLTWLAAQDEPGRHALAAFTASLDPTRAGRVARLAAFALQQSPRLSPPPNFAAALAAIGSNPSPEVAAATDSLAATFGDASILSRQRNTLADTNAPLPLRKAAFSLLARVNDPDALPIFASLLDSPDFRRAVIPLLARSDNPDVAAALLSRYSRLSPPDRSAALATLTSRPTFALALVNAMASGAFPKSDLTALHLRQMQQLGNPALTAALEKTWGRFNPTSDSAKASIARVSKLFSEAPLWAYDAAKGREVFNKVCASCHAHGPSDPKIGPNLAGTHDNGLTYFLENIADPNAVIGDAFQLSIITRLDGSVAAGIIEKDSPDSLTLRTLTESLSIPAKDIKSREKLPQSFMPQGLLDALSDRETIELLKFLTSPP